LETLIKNDDAAFALFSDAALHPAFAADEIERVRSSRITALLQQKDSPQALVGQI